MEKSTLRTEHIKIYLAMSCKVGFYTLVRCQKIGVWLRCKLVFLHTSWCIKSGKWLVYAQKRGHEQGRTKLYSIRIEDKEAINKSKGVKKYVMKKTKITFDDYLRCLFNNSSLSREQCTIRSRRIYPTDVKQLIRTLKP